MMVDLKIPLGTALFCPTAAQTTAFTEQRHSKLDLQNKHHPPYVRVKVDELVKLFLLNLKKSKNPSSQCEILQQYWMYMSYI